MATGVPAAPRSANDRRSRENPGGVTMGLSDPSFHMDEVLQRFSREIGAEYHPGDGPYRRTIRLGKEWVHSYGTVHARAGPWTVSIGGYTRENERTFTQLYCALLEPGRVPFLVTRTDFLTRLARKLGLWRQVDVGFPECDEAFFIAGNDDDKVRTLFAEPRFRELIRRSAVRPRGAGQAVAVRPRRRTRLPRRRGPIVLDVHEGVTDVGRLRALADGFAARWSSCAGPARPGRAAWSEAHGPLRLQRSHPGQAPGLRVGAGCHGFGSQPRPARHLRATEVDPVKQGVRAPTARVAQGQGARPYRTIQSDRPARAGSVLGGRRDRLSVRLRRPSLGPPDLLKLPPLIRGPSVEVSLLAPGPGRPRERVGPRRRRAWPGQRVVEASRPRANRYAAATCCGLQPTIFDGSPFFRP